MDFVKKQNVQKNNMTDAAKRLDRAAENAGLKSSDGDKDSSTDKEAPGDNKGPFHDKNIY